MDSSENRSDRVRMLPASWHPAPWTCNDPPTPIMRLLDWRDRHFAGFGWIGLEWAALVVLVAVGVRLGYGLT